MWARQTPSFSLQENAGPLQVHFPPLQSYQRQMQDPGQPENRKNYADLQNGDKSPSNNYRLITLLYILSKILEKCIFDSLFPYVANPIHQSQQGFQKRKSTISQLLVYLGTMYSNKTADTNIEAVYLDFAKAFNKIDHSILINKLKHIVVGGKLLSIIEDYCSNRKQ